MIAEILVTIGSIIIVLSWIPQIIKLYRRKSSKDISTPFIAIIILGTLMLIPRAVKIGDIYFLSLYIASSSVASIALILALIYQKKEMKK